MGRVLKSVSKLSGQYGQPGEEKVSRELAMHLSDDYVILNSPRFYAQGAIHDIDHVVVGPNGIFVIETKNMHGAISGSLMGNWIQDKRGRSVSETVKIGNPATQVNQYSKIVKTHIDIRLRQENNKVLKLMVYPIVVFAHTDVNLSDLDYTKPGYIGRVKVLKINELADYIKRRDAVDYSMDHVKMISDVLVPVEQRDQTAYFPLEKLNEIARKKEVRYELFEELGRGSFGVVYRAFDYKLDKEIAVKKLSVVGSEDSNLIARFYREAKIASGLNHENIIQVLDYYEDDKNFYIAMELAKGVTLDKYMKNHPVSIKEALRIFRQICSGVVYAHGKHVVHRDLKPSNILVDQEGVVKIADFGIAKLLDSGEATVEGTGPGTLMVMSPEQIKGEEITEKVDIFALGVLLYYLCTGHLPFKGEHMGEIAHKIAYLDPDPPSELNNEIMSDLETIIYKALEKEPNDRFEDAHSFRRAIDELLANGKIVSPIGKRRWMVKYIPRFIRPYIKNERDIFSSITIATLIVVIIILGFQSYKDYSELAKGGVPSQRFKVTNDISEQMFKNPEGYVGFPVDLLGRIEKVTKLNENSTEFLFDIQDVSGKEGRKPVHVIFARPHFDIPLTTNIEVIGSIQGSIKEQDSKIPVVVAEKVQAVEDPWTFIAPSMFTIYPQNVIEQNGKKVIIQKVEFSQLETRLFVRVENSSKEKQTIYLTNPIASQGIRQFKEINTNYGLKLLKTFQLNPSQEAGTVIFLEPMDYKKSSANFTLGSENEVLYGQQPYIFNITW